jgi:hypothetical protein
MTLVRVNESDSRGGFVLLNLRAVAKVECHGFDSEQHRYRATIFTSGGGSVHLVGVDADRVVSALQRFAMILTHTKDVLMNACGAVPNKRSASLI